jgi:threonine/homoserine/homoserine lactone efflux protein
MINWELVLKISPFYFVMFITPGPNNSILSASGIKFGFIRTIPNILGVPCGHAIQLTLVALGLGTLFDLFPVILNILKYVGSLYLFYLAWKMLGSLKVSKESEKGSPLKFYEAVLFQFVNPKAWIICVTAVSLFFPQKENLIVAIFFMVFMATVINLPSISIWAFGGSVIRHYLSNKKIKIVVEWLLAILLAATAISILV